MTSNWRKENYRGEVQGDGSQHAAKLFTSVEVGKAAGSPFIRSTQNHVQKCNVGCDGIALHRNSIGSAQLVVKRVAVFQFSKHVMFIVGLGRAWPFRGDRSQGQRKFSNIGGGGAKLIN